MRTAVLLALLLAAGCSSSSTYRPMNVEVRDRLTRTPVSDAAVHVRAVHFFVPTGDAAILDPSPPRSARGVTGPDGTVRLTVIVGHPVHVIIAAAGYEPFEIDLDTHPARAGATGWIDPDHDTPDADARPRRLLEARFVPEQSSSRAVEQ